MKLLYLFLVGVLNLGLGYALARWLKHRSAPQTLDLSQETRLPLESGEPPKSAGETHELPPEAVATENTFTEDATAAVEQPPPDESDVGASTSVSVPDAEPSEAADPADRDSTGRETAIDMVDPTDADAAPSGSEEQDAAVAPRAHEETGEEIDSASSDVLSDGQASTVQSTTDNTAVRPAIQELSGKFDEAIRDLGEVQRTLEESLEIQESVASIDTTAQQLLQAVNSAVDSASSGEDHQLVELLETCWDELNDQAVKLVAIESESESPESTAASVKEVCGGLESTCRRVHESLVAL